MNDVEAIRSYYRAVLPYYDAALEDRGDLPFWEALPIRWDSKRILELGCGTGRVTEALSRHAPVTAIDLLIEMLRHASRKAPDARLIVADLRQFALGIPFDLVILADDPMAHLTSIEDRTRVMTLIAEHLAPDGRLVLEGLYRERGQHLCVPARKILSRNGEPCTVEEWWSPSEDPSLWNATYRYKRGASIRDVTAVMRSWSRAEVEHLAEAGLHVQSVWGDFDESPFSERSKRMIIVAKRRDASSNA